MLEKLKNMKHSLMCCIEKEMFNLDTADTRELGEAIDMVKDLEEAIYYHTITKAMNEDSEKEHPMYYPYPKMYYDPYRDMDRGEGRMYYSGDKPKKYADEPEHPMAEMRDHREGRSHMSRKGYMEGKEMHHGKEKQMKELEKYMQELTADITEMISGTSPEEKQLLQKKIATLAEKVGQVSV